ncbi:hypothetical protein OH76DRAFT_1361187 [Lentinus brumalis]|uniref:Uncharacterized protein n=1 Tax=Lentinus brumalis TaxID=2498619 RepID=A0A371CT36_9APHY|nr:hypothetical protein OH76DRAFT_1361187 [Polyporus brumalis]
MLLTFVTFAVALVSAVQATPVSAGTTVTSTTVGMSAAAGIPVVSLELGSVSEHGNVTVGKGGMHPSSADDVYPASMMICLESGCQSCSSFDLSNEQQACLIPQLNFMSVWINQPSNQGLPFAVFTGPVGCSQWAQVPLVNTCYNTVNYIGWDYELTP